MVRASGSESAGPVEYLASWPMGEMAMTTTGITRKSWVRHPDKTGVKQMRVSSVDGFSSFQIEKWWWWRAFDVWVLCVARMVVEFALLAIFCYWSSSERMHGGRSPDWEAACALDPFVA